MTVRVFSAGETVNKCQQRRECVARIGDKSRRVPGLCQGVMRNSTGKGKEQTTEDLVNEAENSELVQQGASLSTKL